jgi:hypothetical protein
MVETFVYRVLFTEEEVMVEMVQLHRGKLDKLVELEL